VPNGRWAMDPELGDVDWRPREPKLGGETSGGKIAGSITSPVNGAAPATKVGAASGGTAPPGSPASTTTPSGVSP
jgi:hypothetical protein